MDGQPDLAALAGSRYGDCLLELPLAGGWGLAAAFSPSGSCLAVASQGSQLTLLSCIDLQDPASLDAAAVEAAGRVQHLALPCLPLRCLSFLSEDLLAGGGFDCCPVLCSRQVGGSWQHASNLQGAWAGGLVLGGDYSPVKWLPKQVASCACASGTAELRLHSVQHCAGVKPSSSSGTANANAPAAPPHSASLSARIKMFEQQAAAASAAGGGKAAAGGAAAADEQPTGGAGGKQQSKRGKQQQGIGPHESCIMAVVLLPGSSGDRCLTFLTASLEGCVAEWRVDPATL